MSLLPKISVLLSVFNTPFPMVKRAINSVLKQDVQDFEIIFIDDGSEAALAAEYARYISLLPDKIVYLQHQNCGQSESINRGIACSRGEYITILDADDEIKPNHLSSCLSEMAFADLIASHTETVVDEEADYYVPDRHDNSKVIHVDDCILFDMLFGRRPVFSQFRFNNIYGADARFYEQAAVKYIVRKVNLRTYVYYRNMPGSTCSMLKQNKLTQNQCPQLS